MNQHALTMDHIWAGPSTRTPSCTMSDSAVSVPLVLVVDDDIDTAELVQRWLRRDGFEVEHLPTAEALLDALSRTLPDAVCLDLGLPGMSGLEALSLVRERHRTVPVIVLTGDRGVATVVEAMKSGAHDYLSKPAERTKLVATVRNAATQHQLGARVATLERDVAGPRFDDIVGGSPAMRKMFSQLGKVAPSDITVLLRGQSGTGKELVASAIHKNSARCDGPLIAVNCAAIPESLQDSELFGHEKGAFTGAGDTRRGRFEQADGGTLFLDEVAELTPSLQAKLLRVLQERSFERVGGSKKIRSDFRLVAATHRDLRAMVDAGEFREDLYFRIAVFELKLPPLSEREGDLELLIEALLDDMVPPGAERPTFDAQCLAAMRSYQWPGNVRELANVVQRAVVVAEDGMVRLGDLPDALSSGGPTADVVDAPPKLEHGSTSASPEDLPDSLASLERAAIEREMVRQNGNVSKVGRTLGIGRTTLYRKLREYGLR